MTRRMNYGPVMAGNQSNYMGDDFNLDGISEDFADVFQAQSFPVND